MAGDIGAVVNSYSYIRVLQLPNTEEPFGQADIVPTWSHRSAPLTFVSPSGSRGEKPEVKKHQPRAKNKPNRHVNASATKKQQLNHRRQS